MRENQVIGVLGRYLEPGGEGGLATVTTASVNRPGLGSVFMADIYRALLPRHSHLPSRGS